MNYRDQQAQKAINLRNDMFNGDPGNGWFGNPPHQYEFVLSYPKCADLNLWEGIRDDVLKCFDNYRINWDKSAGKSPIGVKLPTGHLLSSQVACVNHLYFLRQRPKLVTEILRHLDPNIQRACSIIGPSGENEGFVAFEVVGAEKLGKERCLTRGMHCTSIDAMMIGETQERQILFLIEWKYTENYKGKPSKLSSGNTRIENYISLLKADDCPIKPMEDFKPLFYEPFYQLMRQTLFGWKMINQPEYKGSDWRHLHIIPRENRELLHKIASPTLRKDKATLESVWKSLLKSPEKYQVIDPCDFLKPVPQNNDTKDWLLYLKKRYWD